MTRPNQAAGILGRLGPVAAVYHREILLGAVYITAASGILSGSRGGPLLLGLHLAVLLLLALDLSLWWPRHRTRGSRVFMASLTACLLVNLVVQRTGGISSPVWPAYFVVLPATAFIPQRLRVTGALLASVLALEWAGVMLASSFRPGQQEAALLLGYSAALAVSTLVVGKLSHKSVLRALDLEDKYGKIEDDAESLGRLGGGNDWEDVGSLTADLRRMQRMAAAKGLDERLGTVLGLAAGALGADRCGFFQVDATGNKIILRNSVAPPEAGDPQADSGTISSRRRPEPVPVGQAVSNSFLKQAVDEHRHFILGHLDAGDRQGHVLETNSQVRSLAAAPVTPLDVTLGVLVATSTRPDAFRGKEAVLTGFAEQVADLFLHSQQTLRKDEEERISSTMLNISTALAKSIKQDEILATLLDETEKVMKFARGGFFLVEGDDRVRLAMARGIPASAIGRRYDLRKRLLSLVVSHQQRLLFDDLGDRKRRLTGVHSLDAGCRSLIAVPVVLDEKVRGVFVACDPQPSRFDGTHLNFLNILANQVAVVLANASLHRQVETLAVTDGLTGLFNHRHFHEILAAEILRVKRHPEPLSLILLDIDHFKRINDSYGHPFGDVVLKGVAQVLLSLAREVDVVARYGGEEMALLLVNTGRKGADAMAGRVMKGLRDTRHRMGNLEATVTASLGSATFPDDGETAPDLVKAADKALYRSKDDGRDRHTPASLLRGER